LSPSPPTPPSPPQAALPFKSKPKTEAGRKRKPLEARRAVVLEPAEKKAAALLQQLNAIRNQKSAKRKEQQVRWAAARPPAPSAVQPRLRRLRLRQRMAVPGPMGASALPADLRPSPLPPSPLPQDRRRVEVSKRQAMEERWRAEVSKEERKKRYREVAAVEKRKELGAKRRKMGKGKAAKGGGGDD
jgi:hypothetical protein